MNILLRMAFNGTAYHGFQVQKNAPSVCQTLQDAMQRLFGARPDVKGCSRTDAGVHARDFCVSFKHQTAIPPAKLPLALNSHLPPDIRVFEARWVPEAFHARYSAAGKEYTYHILNAAVDDVFAPGLYHRVVGPLDVELMHQAAQYLVGTHDFAAFMAAGSTVQSTVRTVHAAAVSRMGGQVVFTVSANGFLYNMVRIMAGTLLLAGRQQLPPEGVEGIVAGGLRLNAGPTLPAKGLFLNRVFYPEEALAVKDGPNGAD